MNTNKQIRSNAMNVIKSGNITMLIIFIAAFIYIPLFTLFMPKITILLYAALSFFLYPYTRLSYQVACGKTLELEDILDFSGFLSYLGTQIRIILKAFPFILGSIISLFMIYVIIIDPNWWPFIFEETLENILFYGSIVTLFLFSFLTLIVQIKYRLSCYYIFDGLNAKQAMKECKKDMKKKLLKYIGFMFPFFLLILLSCVLFGLPLVIMLPYTLLAESGWYYQLHYGCSCSGTYYRNSNDLVLGQTKQENVWAQHQQQREKTLQGQTKHTSLVNDFENLGHTKPQQPQQMPMWPPQQPIQPQNVGYTNTYYQNYPYPSEIQGTNGYCNIQQQIPTMPQNVDAQQGGSYEKVMGITKEENNE